MKVAITGTIGSGKSEVSNHLRRLGYDVFDCDKENSDILNECAYKLLSYHFAYCFDNKLLSKKKLADKVFNNSDNKKILEAIMHPLILARLISRSDDPLFAEVPLLFESNWQTYFDETILVVSDNDIVIDRLKNRGYSNLEINMRINSQMSVQEKINKASRIIYNNGSLDELYLKIDECIKDILC